MIYILMTIVATALGGFWYGRVRAATAETGAATAARSPRANARVHSDAGALSEHARTTCRKTARDAAEYQWHAISVEHGEGCCSAAKAIAGTRFLSVEAPATPLRECDTPVCRCRYRHHDDRRASDDERRNPASLCSQLHDAAGKPERRSRRGRRASDLH